MPSRKLSHHIIRYVFRAICLLFIFAVISLLVWRMISSSVIPKAIKPLSANQALADAYEKSGEKLTVFTQKQDTITRGEENSGYFSIARALFIEEAEQLQIIFKYNNSTLKHLKADYKLDNDPVRDEDHYDISVLVAYDLTPENSNDNDGNDPDSVRFERYFLTSQKSASNKLYNYRQFTFDGIKIDSSVLAVYVDVYYNKDIDYEKTPYGTLCIYDYDTEKKTYRLTSKDKSAIENFMKSTPN